jgi:Tfp pilus assembly protein FimT
MNKGLSLLETMIMIFILAVLLQVGATSFHRLEPKYRLQAAAWEIVSRLNHARFRAIQDGAPVRVKFGESRYRLEEWDEEANIWRLVDGSALAGVTLKANNTPVFYPEGTVSNLATILVSNDRGGYRITLAMTGRVKAVPI